MPIPDNSLHWRERLHLYARLTRLDRPIGIYLLLWPTLWTLWLASGGLPSAPLLLVFVLGVILMRSAGCAINDYADRHVDPHVARTRDRPLASGKLAPREALIVFALIALTAFLLVLSLNPLTIALAFVGLALAASYPFMKRFHHLPQLHLGLAYGWSIPMAWAAVANDVPWPAFALFLANILWTVAYDTMYAMADREDDLKIGVKSTAILFGQYDIPIIALLQLAALLTLYGVGLLTGRGLPYDLGLMGAALTVLWQLYLLRHRRPDDCLRAFRNNNLFGALVFAGIGLDFALAPAF
ncbi:MAG: 4-hydroxybenzoate octaprenyltransferase [Halothiobacillaceae bacterium]|nr:4-hydroxybenzoate octaprenyltransferase [Halothiobacillaceae bacterium]